MGCEVLSRVYVSVCLSVCLLAYVLFICHTVICMHVARDRGSVLLGRNCDALCTSGSVDDMTGSMARHVYVSVNHTLEIILTGLMHAWAVM